MVVHKLPIDTSFFIDFFSDPQVSYLFTEKQPCRRFVKAWNGCFVISAVPYTTEGHGYRGNNPISENLTKLLG